MSDTPAREVVTPEVVSKVSKLARLGLPEWAADGGVVTVGGLAVARLGRVPAPGETVTVDGVTLRVLESDGKVVRALSVESTPMPAEPEDAPA